MRIFDNIQINKLLTIFECDLREDLEKKIERRLSLRKLCENK